MDDDVHSSSRSNLNLLRSTNSNRVETIHPCLRSYTQIFLRVHSSLCSSRSSSCFLHIRTSCSATAAASSKKKGSRPRDSSPSSSSSSFFTPALRCALRVRRLTLCVSFRRFSFLSRSAAASPNASDMRHSSVGPSFSADINNVVHDNVQWIQVIGASQPSPESNEVHLTL
jgi:hypothetical protein